MSHYYAGLDTKDKLVTDMTNAGVDTSIFKNYKLIYLTILGFII